MWDMGCGISNAAVGKESGGRRKADAAAKSAYLGAVGAEGGGEVLRYKNNGRQDRGFGDKRGYEGPIGFGWRESEGHWDKFEFL